MDTTVMQGTTDRIVPDADYAACFLAGAFKVQQYGIVRGSDIEGILARSTKPEVLVFKKY